MGAQLHKRWNEHRASVQAVAFRPDGRLLASCASDGTICLWECRVGRLLWRWEFSGVLFDITFNPDGRQLAVGGEGVVWFCPVPPHTPPTRPIACEGEVLSVAFCPNGRRFAAGTTNGTAYLWNPQTQLLLGKLPHDNEVNGVAFSPDSRLLATATQDGLLSLWEAQTGRRLATALRENVWLTAIAFSPDGQWLACGLETGELVVLALATGQTVWRHEAHRHPILSLAFSPNNQLLVSGSADATARLWQVPQWKSAPGLLSHQQAVTGVACTSLGEPTKAVLLATGSRDKTVCCWTVSPAAPFEMEASFWKK